MFNPTKRPYHSLMVTLVNNVLTTLSIKGITQLKVEDDHHLKNTIDRTLIEFIPEFTHDLTSNKYIFESEAKFFKEFSNARPTDNPFELITRWITLLDNNQSDRDSFAETCILQSSLAATVKSIIQETINEAQHVVNNTFDLQSVIQLLKSLAQKNANIFLYNNKSIHFYRQSYLEQLADKVTTLVNLEALAKDMLAGKDISDIAPYCKYTLTDAMFMQTARGAMNLAYDSTLLSAGAAQNNPVAKKWGETITQIYANPFSFDGLDPSNDPLRHTELLTDLVTNKQDRYVEAALLARCDAQVRALHDFTDMIDMLHAPHETDALKKLREFMLKLLDTANNLQKKCIEAPSELTNAFLLLSNMNGLRKFGIEMLQNPKQKFTEHDLYVKINMIFGGDNMDDPSPAAVESRANRLISVAALGFNEHHIAAFIGMSKK
jgi:hypothetical protein